MVKTILFTIPVDEKEVYEQFAEIAPCLPPLGLAYNAAVLEKNGYEVKIRDTYALKEDINEFVDYIVKEKPDIIGAGVLTFNFQQAIKVTKMIKEHLPNTKVVFGGPHATRSPEEVINSGLVDLAVIGESEYTFLEIVEHYSGKKKKLSEIDGIAYKEKNKIIKTKPRSYIINLDELPFPAYHLLPMDKYHPAPNGYKKLPAGIIMASRGCPFTCTFCDRPIFGQKYRIRSAENVIAEMKILKEKYSMKEIDFFDEMFGINKKWLDKFCNLLIESKLDLLWSAYHRCDNVNQEILKKMKQAGCWRIFYGVESGSQEVLDTIKKRETVQDMRNAIKWTKEAGIEVMANFMLGLPNEDPKKAEETIRLAIETDPDYVKFQLTTPFKGTELFENFSKFGTMSGEQSDFNTYTPVFVPYGYKDKEELLAVEKKAYRKFYLRPKYLIRRLYKMRTLEDFRRNLNGFLAIVKWNKTV